MAFVFYQESCGDPILRTHFINICALVDEMILETSIQTSSMSSGSRASARNAHSYACLVLNLFAYSYFLEHLCHEGLRCEENHVEGTRDEGVEELPKSSLSI